MAKVSNTMATKVALDMVEASTAVKNLTTLVNSHTQAWKAQTAALRSAGDYVGAAKAKYEGLGNAISAQRNKIEALEQKQAEMNNIDKKTADRYMELRSKLNQYRSEMDKLDTTTAKGEARSKELAEQIAKTKEQLNGLDTGTVKSAEQFLKYGQQVDRAKAKLASLQAQQQRAAQQIDVENSGVIRLTASMRTQAALATATAERLRSEGNSYQAMGVEVNGLRAKLDSLRQIQLREAELLASTKARSGETSEAYLKQATRVEELGTKIQETRSKLNELNETMSKTPHGWLAGVSARLDNIQGKADRVSTSFGRIFGATAAANMFTGALGSVQARLGDLVKAGVDYDVEQNKMVATWTTLTGSAKKAGPLVDSINNMSKATGQNVDIVNELEQGFYHLNSSKKQADGMTSSLLNMADAVGLNGDQIKAVEQDMVHGMATGKITQGELNQIGSYFPMIDEAMAKHFNTTVAGMLQMASAGKISAKDLQEVFEQLGNGKYKEAAENMMNSYFGVFRTIQSRTPQLVGDITKPFMNISNPFLKSVRNWVNDKSTDAEFTKLGNQMARSMNQIISAFGGTNVSATKLMDNAIRGLTAGVQKFGDIVSSHHTQIANFFSAFKTGSAAQAKIFASVFMDLSKVMLPVLDTMAKFPKTSAALITSFLLASRAVKTLQAGVKGLETIKTVSGVIGTFSQKIKSIPNRKITKIQVDGAQSTHDLQSYSNRLERIPKTKHTVVSASTTQANRNLGAVQRQAQRVPRAISVRATANTTQAVTNIARVGTTSQTAATLSRTSFTLIGTSAKIASTGLSLIGGPAGAIMLVIQGFQLLYQHSAKFRKFVDGIANAAKSMAGKVGRWFGNMATSAGKHINRMAQSAKRGWNNMNRTSQQSSQREIRLHNQMAQRNQRAALQMWNRLRRFWLQGWNRSNQLTRRGVQQQIQQHRTMSTRIAVFNTQLWNRSRQAFTKGWNDLRNSTRNGTNNINNEFNRMKVAVGQRAQQAMNDAKNHFQRGYSDIKSNTSGWRGDMANIWSDTRGKIGNIADNLRGDATNKFSDMHSKLNDLTDNGLGRMHDAWHNRLEGIAEVVTNSGGHIFNQFKNVLNNLAKPFESLINGIKDGINWILDHVGGDGKLGSFSFPGFANGTNGPIEKDQLALLNDAPGSHYQEMVHRGSTGETFMLPAKRNMVFPLQKGDEVLDGERSHKLATMMQMPIPHANGAVGDFFSGLWNGAKELEDIAEDALKNVVGFGKSLFGHFIASVTPKSTDKLNSGLKLNLPGFYAEHLKNWMKKQLEQMEDDNSGSVTAEMIKKAAAKMKVSVSAGDISHILNVVQHESGGNARAINNWDINAQEGHPSKGVLQFIDGTFNKYAVKGHHNIWKPFDQILAMFNDSTWRSDLTLGGWGPTGAPRGFANGGIATEPSIFGEAGAEMAIPLDTMKSTRAWQLLRQVVNFYSGGQVTNNSTSLTDLSKIEKKFDTVLAQNTALINAIERLIGVTDSANNPTARYRRTQRDINLAQAQSLTGI
ncbi:tape measure protein [Limosilactobacillus reuteri]|uniref:tape measure protein n=1 Tax=Limosilactobacillus reuteri TaxID=1598 RepID=UPI00117C16CA|nr:tape measure protein [Limosilactobacillus reuteri]MCT3202717.1 tape measure protein [Limosilactobacillus reuteri]MCT3212517.1 tape measure protein [Limosilactobacillus reuteri]TSB20909.1 tape measure protein [Limosilactobacillus reuteri]UAW61768.1 tape measure protein [Limosilactobacillus reuteri]